jgi:GT2 family glycosyltransferase
MAEKKVGIVILTHNQKKMLIETIDSLIKNTKYNNYKIFLVDNASKDRHDLEVKKKFPKVKVLRQKENQGFSGGNDIGMRTAAKEYDPDYFLMLNDDLEFHEKDWLKKIVDYAEKNKKVGCVGVQLVYPDGEFQDAGGYLKKWQLTKVLKFKQGEILDVDHFMGACILVKRKVIKEIGGLDEIYNPFLLEDSDFFLRAKKAGYEVRVMTNVKIIHKKSKTVGSFTNKKHLSSRFKNDIIFSLKNLSFHHALFRIFIYAPLVAIFKKKKDQEKITNWRNYFVRKKALENIFLLMKAYVRCLVLLPKIIGKNKSFIYE